MATFSERLRELRKSRGWSQDVLADKLGTTRSCVGNYEQGTRKPDMEALEQIADLFNVDMSYLTGKQDITHKNRILNNEDLDLRRIERARSNMPDEEKEKMMKLLELSFDKYFI